MDGRMQDGRQLLVRVVRPGQQVLKAIRDPRARQALQDLPELKVTLVQQAPWVRKAIRARRAQLARMARKGRQR